MILRIVLALLVLVACILLFAAAKPDTFHIERSITISAPPAKVFALIDDFHNWPQWAPQDRDDPAMQRAYSGAKAGLGAICDWTGTKGSTGAGRMTITQDAPAAKVTVAADWRKPFPVRNTNEFTLAPAAQATQLTWSIPAQISTSWKSWKSLRRHQRAHGLPPQCRLSQTKERSRAVTYPADCYLPKYLKVPGASLVIV
jgi:uncharacterized protein YndB with AHSA1/START domain